MLRYTKLSMLVVTVLWIASIPGCGGSGDVVGLPPADVAASVQGSSPAAADAAGESNLVGTAVTGMMGLITTTAPAVQGGAAAAVTPSCPATFDLGNGITGTCTSLDSGGVSFVFGGTVAGPYGPVTVNGTLVATPTADQPASGSRWSIDFHATAVGPRGTATWSATGTVTLDANDHVVDFQVVFTHTRTPTGGSTAVVTVTITPDQLTLVIAGAGGHTLRIDVNRQTMTGTIQLDGVVVASVTFQEGCAVVNYVDPNLQDVTVCPTN